MSISSNHSPFSIHMNLALDSSCRGCNLSNTTNCLFTLSFKLVVWCIIGCSSLIKILFRNKKDKSCAFSSSLWTFLLCSEKSWSRSYVKATNSMPPNFSGWWENVFALTIEQVCSAPFPVPVNWARLKDTSVGRSETAGYQNHNMRPLTLL